MIKEGSKVFYTGTPTATLQIGDAGKAISVSGKVVAVKWATGPSAGQFTEHYDHDLAKAGSQTTVLGSLEDSLDVGGLVAFSARQVCDEGGVRGVLAAMAETGHLAAFTDIAEEAVGLVQSRIRHDASFRAIAAALEEDEVDDLVHAACLVVLREVTE